MIEHPGVSQLAQSRIRLTGRPTLLFNFFEKIHN
jgi:hypothetical protein